MSFRAHPLALKVHSSVSTPSARACGVCGHHALYEEPVVSGITDPGRLICQVCGAHAITEWWRAEPTR